MNTLSKIQNWNKKKNSRTFLVKILTLTPCKFELKLRKQIFQFLYVLLTLFCTTASSWSVRFESPYIQGVSEISTLILTGNRTRQKEQLFYLPFCRKTMFNSKKKIGEIFH
jgi:hypothetical protein